MASGGGVSAGRPDPADGRPGPADGRPAGDVAGLASVFGAALRNAGIPAGPDRSQRFADALTVTGTTSVEGVHACALATMVSDPSQIPTFERVFNAVFSPAPPRPGMPQPPVIGPPQEALPDSPADLAPSSAGASADDTDLKSMVQETGEDVSPSSSDPDADGDVLEAPAIKRVATATETLRGRDFSELTPAELRNLALLMRQLTIAVPPRRTRRYRPRKDGDRLDMRRTLRQARRTGGEPVTIARRAVRDRPRRLVVLCDISGSMEPYARALLQLMYVAARSGSLQDPSRPRTEVFTFATRLTRLTPALSAATPETMLARAGEAAPDWSGGTRIGAALREFNDKYGVRGMGRGAVVLIISDGWETGDPSLLGEQMARLHRVAYRIVWANPRTQSPRYRPEVGGMAAAWPYCDAVVSAHNFEALDDLLEALRSKAPRRPAVDYAPVENSSPPAGPQAPGAPGISGASDASASRPASSMYTSHITPPR